MKEILIKKCLRKLWICLAVIFGICLAGGCSRQTPPENSPAGDEPAITNSDNSVFSTGMKAEESDEDAAAPTDTAASGNAGSSEDAGSTEGADSSEAPDTGIEERCPDTASSKAKGISYPEAEHVTYYSETCKMDRGVNILLPADYDPSIKYPVFYILHGIFGDENSFTGDKSNRIKEIVTNMAVQNNIQAPIIVFPNMYATDDPEQKPAFDAAACEPYDNFVNDLVNDLMPFMAKNYSVLTDRENTWLAGFSMGGRETLYITLCHPELFGYVCAISPAPGLVPGKDNFMTHPGTLSEEEVKFDENAVLPNVLMICCGTRDSVVGKFPLNYHKLFDANGIEHIWYEIPGADHDNNAIKSGIYNLMKQIANYNK